VIIIRELVKGDEANKIHIGVGARAVDLPPESLHHRAGISQELEADGRIFGPEPEYRFQQGMGTFVFHNGADE
jgi:hypothetical protein